MSVPIIETYVYSKWRQSRKTTTEHNVAISELWVISALTYTSKAQLLHLYLGEHHRRGGRKTMKARGSENMV